MKRNKKSSGKAMSMPGGLALGVLISLAVTFLMALLMSKMILCGWLEESQIGYGSMITLLTASFLGATTAKERIKHRKGMVSMLSGAMYFLILLCMTALFFGGQYYGMGVTGLVILGGSGTAALVSVRKRNRVAGR